MKPLRCKVCGKVALYLVGYYREPYCRDHHAEAERRATKGAAEYQKLRHRRRS